ncbi:MAG: hypothetical protein J6C84_05395 [Lachnospiraceae bacterium]|nr:hypothetical protein [Lachnospiraceae bacterium]
MNRSAQKKIHIILCICCLLLPLSLSGCGKKGRLDEGNCKCSISFTDIPKEFGMLEENLSDTFEINVCLKNTINETPYYITLNKENDYSAQISLHPGTYQICYVSNNMEKYNGISVAANVENVTLSEDTPEEILISVDNQEAFTQNWMATQPMPEMLLADKFSGQIQINRRIVNIRDILSELTLEASSDSPVRPYQKLELSDQERGITVTVLNNSEESLPWTGCEVIGIRVCKNNVVFPEGVTLGMSAKKVLHKTDGLYGEPDRFSGSPLLGWGLDDTRVIYSDPDSGNKITIGLSSGGTYITDITYELACFE